MVNDASGSSSDVVDDDEDETTLVSKVVRHSSLIVRPSLGLMY